MLVAKATIDGNRVVASGSIYSFGEQVIEIIPIPVGDNPLKIRVKFTKTDKGLELNAENLPGNIVQINLANSENPLGVGTTTTIPVGVVGPQHRLLSLSFAVRTVGEDEKKIGRILTYTFTAEGDGDVS